MVDGLPLARVKVKRLRRYREAAVSCMIIASAVGLAGCASSEGVSASELARADAARERVPQLLAELDVSPPSGYERLGERITDECAAMTVDRDGWNDRAVTGYECTYAVQFLLVPTAAGLPSEPGNAVTELADRWGEDPSGLEIYHEARPSGKPADIRVTVPESQTELRDDITARAWATTPTVVQATQFDESVFDLPDSTAKSSMLMTVSLHYFRYVDKAAEPVE